LSNFKFSNNYRLSRCNFDGSDLSGTIFDCGLSYCSFVNCIIKYLVKINSTDLNNTLWTGIDFKLFKFIVSVNFTGSIFKNCIFTDVDCSKFGFTGCTFIKCIMSKGNFAGSNFSDSVFNYCNCDDTNFSGCNMSKTKRSNTEFKNSNLSNAIGVTIN